MEKSIQPKWMLHAFKGRGSSKAPSQKYAGIIRYLCNAKGPHSSQARLSEEAEEVKWRHYCSSYCTVARRGDKRPKISNYMSWSRGERESAYT